MLVVHCVAHRVPLASNGIHTIDVVARVDQYLRSVWSWYSKSTRVRLEALHLMQTFLDEAVLNPLEVHVVRWLGVVKCLENYLRIEDAVLAKFSSDKDKLAKPADRNRAEELYTGR